MDNESEKAKPEGHGKVLILHIVVPREVDPQDMEFDKNIKVADAAKQVADKFGYVGGTPTFQNAAGDLLDRDKPLAGEHVRDGDTLRYVDSGGGV